MTRRILRGAGVVTVLAGALLLAGAPAALAAPAESISTYDTRVEVQASGQMRITETIAYDFGANERHGIIRKIPARFRYDDHHDRVYPIDGVTVTMDGARVTFGRSSDSGYEIFKIGDPKRTIHGSHTYVIGYTVQGGLNGFPDHDELYWNVVGDEWEVPIAAATATVTGPATIERTACYAGPNGSRLGCESASADGATATFRQQDLGDRSGLTAVVAFPKGSVGSTAPILVDRHDLTSAFQITPATVGGGVGLGLVGVAGALAVGWLVGRDRRYIGPLPGLVPEPGEPEIERRKPLTGKPPVSVEFTPPYDVRPGQVGTLIDEQANVVDVTATIIDFAVRKHLHITEIAGTGNSRAQDWELTRLTSGDPNFLPYERTLFDALFRDRDSVLLSELKYTFASDLKQVQRHLYTDMVAQGWYRASPERTRNAARGIAILLLILAAGITVLLGLFTHAALLGVGLVVGALVLLIVAGKFPARTGRGSAMLERVLGFRLYVATAEKEQIKFQEREQIFSRYLPYAMVFGLVDRWARTFADLDAVRPDGTSGLYWYAGLPGWNMLYYDQSIGNFTTTTVGTIASTPPSASGSSGFSGGFSGGGGGGGGGGSW
jgi:Predicted membrane protein (DUF2207) C-terminal domain/Predicted membrane protein (DUF2207) N-terminal domain